MIYLVKISYYGKAYHGVVPQKDVKTVIGEILEFFDIKEYKLSIVSRTDRGVSAEENYFVLYSNKEINWMNFYSENIRILKVFKLKKFINIRKFSLGKLYHYLIPKDKIMEFKLFYPKYLYLDGIRFVINKKFGETFDFNKFVEASKKFIGKKSFHNFSKGNKIKNTICFIRKFDIIEKNNGIEIYIEGNRFLYEMIRRIISFLILVSRDGFPMDLLDYIFIFNLDPKPNPANPEFLTLKKVYLDWNKIYKYIQEIII